ncbi:MAG: PGF-pre-PGF domain-containing protein [Candidatus Woesearchaeota archaeon]
MSTVKEFLGFIELALFLLFFSQNGFAQNRTKSFFREWDLLMEGVSTTEIPKHQLTENFSITRFDLHMNKSITNARISIEESHNYSIFENLSALGIKIYSFLNITHNIPESALSRTEFYFKVKNEFIENKSKSGQSSIALLLFDRKNVEEQETTEYSKDEHFHYFKAEMSSLKSILIVLKESPYKIVLDDKKEQASENRERANKANEANKTAQNKTGIENAKQTRKNSRDWLIAPLVVMLLIIIYFVYETSRKRPKSVIVD